MSEKEKDQQALIVGLLGILLVVIVGVVGYFANKTDDEVKVLKPKPTVKTVSKTIETKTQQKTDGGYTGKIVTGTEPGTHTTVISNEKWVVNKFEVYSKETYKNIPSNKYLINSKEEIDAFNELFSDKAGLTEELLDKGIIFVQVETLPKGSEGRIYKTYNDSDFRLYITYYPNVDGNTFAYYVVVVDRESLENTNTSAWKSPLKVLNNPELFRDLSNYKFSLDNDKKYIVETELEVKHTTGKTYESEYGKYTYYSHSENKYTYDIDLVNNVVVKINEYSRHDNSGYPTTRPIEKGSSIVYKKVIDKELSEEIYKEMEKIGKKITNDEKTYKIYWGSGGMSEIKKEDITPLLEKIDNFKA